MVVRETSIMVIIALRLKWGTPKKKSWGVWNQAASLTGVNDTWPRPPAINEATRIPIRMAIDFMKPRAKALMTRMIIIVKKPTNRFVGFPNDAAVGVPPPRS